MTLDRSEIDEMRASFYVEHLDRIAALESENAELKLRLKEYADTTAEHHKSEKAAWAENAELRAQIESERKEYRDAANEGAKRSQEEIEKLQADLAEAQRERLNTVGICEEEVKDVRAENERLRKTLAVAYDREAESDDENARTIARLRDALKPMGDRSRWGALESGMRKLYVTKAELEAAHTVTERDIWEVSGAIPERSDGE